VKPLGCSTVGAWFDLRCLSTAVMLVCCSGTEDPIQEIDGPLCVPVVVNQAALVTVQSITMVVSLKVFSTSAREVDARD
jgi:hypothetical protein